MVVFYDRLENFLYDSVLSNIEDWYNNEGGDGYVFIMVPSVLYRRNFQCLTSSYLRATGPQYVIAQIRWRSRER
jgi:hypothetical protein